MKLNSKQLRITRPKDVNAPELHKNPIYIVLDNVMDTYNTGAIFRLAEAVGACEMLLCGGTEYPPNTRLHKAAVGTEEWVKWRYFPDALSAVKTLRSEVKDIKVVVVEQDEQAVQLKDLRVDLPVAIVVGHETNGVGQEVISEADIVVEIPMWGVNKSLNVVVSTGIVVYRLLS